MNAPSAQGGSRIKDAGPAWWLWALVGLVVCLVAVSGDSVWIDEALTAQEAAHETAGGMWQMVLHDKGSDLQMPLYIFCPASPGCRRIGAANPKRDGKRPWTSVVRTNHT
jgi:hypothetical protein